MSRRRRRPPGITPDPDPDPIESAVATITASVDNNTIVTNTTYSGVSELGNEWIVDAFLTFSSSIPASANVEITVPAIGGGSVVIGPVSSNEPI